MAQEQSVKKDPAEQNLSQKIIRNVTWNLLGQSSVALVTFLATPFILRSLSVDLFGIYVFIGIIVGYFSFLQLGLGAASIKYISQYLANKEEDKIRKAFWSCLLFYNWLGLFGSLVIFVSAPMLVENWLKIPQEVKIISISALRLGAIGFFVSMLSGAVSSVLQAASRFDILNRVAVLLGFLQIITTVIVLKLGFSLKVVIISGILFQILGTYIYWVNAKKIFPFISKAVWDPHMLIKLFKFGGFVTVSSIISPLLVNSEKIILTALRPISELTYYSVPYSLMIKLAIIPLAFSTVIFPVFSHFQGSADKRINTELHFRSTVYIIFLYLFFTAIFVFFGKQFLAFWLGKSFAERSTGILIILSLAGLINALAFPSFFLLQGVGKPNLPALFHFIELIIYIPFAYIFINRFGGLGAAMAWFLRIVLDTALLNKASCDVLGKSLLVWYRDILFRVFVPLVFCCLAIWCLKMLNFSFLSSKNILGIFMAFILYGYSVWRFGLDNFARVKVNEFLSRVTG